MKKEEFYFDSADGKNSIRALRLIPDQKPVGVLQIAHGMAEFIDRYQEFAEYLCDKGYIVTGNDHLGHGGSVKTNDDLGYIGSLTGYKLVVDDMFKLTQITKELFPDLKYFLLGHSMGSFLCRYYLFTYGFELDGAIVMGTGQQAKAALSVAKTLTKSVAATKGWHYRSTMLNALATGSYNKKWEPSVSHVDWLTKDEKIVAKYFNEPKCGFTFTTDGFYNLFSLLDEIVDKENINRMPKDLPILITSGTDDPVGNFSKDPIAVEKIFKEIGVMDVSLKLYESDRHEILNETDKKTVYKNIYNWLENKRLK